MKEWEYKIVQKDRPLSEKELNEIGKDCWEMCGYDRKPGFEGYENITYIFKKPTF